MQNRRVLLLREHDADITHAFAYGYCSSVGIALQIDIFHTGNLAVVQIRQHRWPVQGGTIG